jgi:hypothetical protein
VLLGFRSRTSEVEVGARDNLEPLKPFAVLKVDIADVSASDDADVHE